MEPDILVGWEQPGQTGTNNPDNVTKHGDENQPAIVCKNETSSTRSPHRPCQTIQREQFLVDLLLSFMSECTGKLAKATNLTVPSIGEPEDVRTIEKNVEYETSRSQELALEPVFAHDY